MTANPSAESSRVHHGAGPASDRPSPEGRRTVNSEATPHTVTVRVALSMSRRGGRKVVVTPSGSPAWAPQRRRIDITLVKAIARAHRWQRMMESGEYASVAELAAAARVNHSYLCRILRLTLLSPEIIEAVLDRRGHTPKLHDIMRPFPTEWKEQKELLA